MEEIISLAALFFRVIVDAMIVALMGKKVRQERLETGRYNRIRLIYVGIFATDLYTAIFENILFEIGVIPTEYQVGLANIGFNSFSIGIQVAVGFMLPLTIINWKSMMWAPVYFTAGQYIFFFLTGMDFMWIYFIMVGSNISLISVGIVAFKLKDNGALGFFIFFSIALVSLGVASVSGLTLFSRIVDIGRYSFALLFITGRFAPFKKESAVDEFVEANMDDDSRVIQAPATTTVNHEVTN